MNDERRRDALPDLGAQLRPVLAEVPPAIWPRLVAQLERAAADRYDAWASSCGDEAQRAGLRACAAREREVASRIEAAFPAHPEEQRYMSATVPKIAAAYAAVMADHPVDDQYAIQAAAERNGAAFWRSVAGSAPAAREVLEACARLEEASAEFLERL
jgi:hypothetical protein